MFDECFSELAITTLVLYKLLNNIRMESNLPFLFHFKKEGNARNQQESIVFDSCLLYAPATKIVH